MKARMGVMLIQLGLRLLLANIWSHKNNSGTRTKHGHIFTKTCLHHRESEIVVPTSFQVSTTTSQDQAVKLDGLIVFQVEHDGAQDYSRWRN